MQEQITKVSFEGQQVCAGIDVHKSNWKVTISVGDTLMKTFSQDPNPDVLLKHLKKNYPLAHYKVGYEAGFSGFWAWRKLKEAGVEAVVLNPADIPTTHKDKTQKEDGRDSRKIVKCVANNEKGIYVPSRQQEQARYLLRVRYALSKDMQRTKNRIKASLMVQGIEYPDCFKKPGTHWSRRFIDWLSGLEREHPCWKEGFDRLLSCLNHLRKEKLEITRSIRKLSKSEPYFQQADILLSVPGIGLITAMTLLTELGDIARFIKPDHMVSYLGFIPTTHSSGPKEKTGNMTMRHNRYLRNMLIESAWTLIRTDPAMGLKYAQLTERMSNQKAIVRISKKLVLRIRKLLLTQTYYQMGVA